MNDSKLPPVSCSQILHISNHNFYLFLFFIFFINFFIIFSLLSCRDKDLKSCQLIASDKSNLLRKVCFLLKSGSPVIGFSILLEVGYLDAIVLNLVYKWQHLFLGHYKIIPNWVIFLECFSEFHYGYVALLFFKGHQIIFIKLLFNPRFKAKPSTLHWTYRTYI